ncbi:hypothetical protein [Leptothoe sp. PORK10 BA2]|nr:hypothetical protein [Leptothoe sp. PORK10 BA2]
MQKPLAPNICKAESVKLPRLAQFAMGTLDEYSQQLDQFFKR